MPIDKLIEFEGETTWLYLCTGGKVTTAIGHALGTVEEALAMPWDQPPEVVRRDYATVRLAPVGRVAAWYRQFTKSRLPASFVREDGARTLERMRAQFARLHPEHATWPAPVREAMDDLLYSLGPGFLRSGEWPRLRAAVESRNWTVAANECRRPQLSAARNNYVAGLLRQAATKA